MCCDTECYIHNFKSKEDTFAFQHIADNIHELKMIYVLMKHVEQWILEQLPPFVDTVKIIQSRNLKWISIPQSLPNLEIKYTGLRRIDIAANSSLSIFSVFNSYNLMKVPLAVKNAPKLQYLRLRECGLSKIDLAAFCDNAYLSELFLDSNKIRYIVNTSRRNCSFYNSLTSLKIPDNLLTTVNLELFNVFVNLRKLDFQVNRITSLSDRLAQSTLEYFKIDNNKLEHVDLCGWDVPSMNWVSIATNYLTTLPECINNWTNVSMLALSGNMLTNFSIESVAGMNRLTRLYLECNKITNIVLSSEHFPKNLTFLKIDLNYLTTLDLSFIPVKSLCLSVIHNLISNFDASNCSPNVTKLWMLGNPLQCTWERRLEQLYGECYRDDTYAEGHHRIMKGCDKHSSRLIYD